MLNYQFHLRRHFRLKLKIQHFPENIKLVIYPQLYKKRVYTYYCDLKSKSFEHFLFHIYYILFIKTHTTAWDFSIKNCLLAIKRNSKKVCSNTRMVKTILILIYGPFLKNKPIS